MARDYLKKATLTSKSDASDVKQIVRGILDDIEAGGEHTRQGAAKTENWSISLRCVDPYCSGIDRS